MLVKGLMKRRFWWVQEDDYKNANFSWTQLKINYLFQQQAKAESCLLDCKIESSDDERKKKRSKKNIESKSPTKSKALFRAPLPHEKDKILTTADKRILSIV